jgi:hypothetical protein
VDEVIGTHRIAFTRGAVEHLQPLFAGQYPISLSVSIQLPEEPMERVGLPDPGIAFGPVQVIPRDPSVGIPIECGQPEDGAGELAGFECSLRLEAVVLEQPILAIPGFRRTKPALTGFPRRAVGNGQQHPDRFGGLFLRIPLDQLG